MPPKAPKQPYQLGTTYSNVESREGFITQATTWESEICHNWYKGHTQNHKKEKWEDLNRHKNTIYKKHDIFGQ